MHKDSLDSLSYAMEKIGKTAASMNISLEEAIAAINSLAATSAQFKDIDINLNKRGLYKTLNYKHELL